MHRYIPKHIRFLFIVYCTGIIAFTLPRIILYFLHQDEIKAISFLDVMHSFILGFRFDSVVSGYILMVPLLILTAVSFFNSASRVWYGVISTVLTFLYCIAIFITIADIPFFNHFGSRMSVSVFSWTESPTFMFKMITQDSTYYPYIVFVIVLLFVTVVVINKFKRAILLRNDSASKDNPYYIADALFSVLSIIALLIAIRGRVMEKSPIRWGTAFFSTSAFINQLGLNPVFTLTRSWLDEQDEKNKRIHFLNDEMAIRNVQRYLRCPETSWYDSPIARLRNENGIPNNMNVVLVIMESVSAEKMKRYGNTKNITPTLDSLSEISSIFDNFYSAGIHTFNGVYSSLFGFPALLSKHPMRNVESLQPFTGVAKTLSEHNYQTIFFCPHDEQFDNMGGFLSFNGFQKIVSEKDYPQEKVLSTLGVPDGVMFEQSIPYLKNLHESGKPFFATLLTSSHHGPYIVPTDIPFKPKPGSDEEQTLEYADWSVNHFMRLAMNESWYSNTIFLFTGDHGYLSRISSSIELSLNHIPFIVFIPSEIKKREPHVQVGGQIDIYPTIMGLVNIPYINNTIGVDLFNEERSFMFFGEDDKIGCIDNEYLLSLSNQTSTEELYRYTTNNTLEYAKQFPAIVDSMKTYAYSMLQVTQWLITNKQVGEQKMNLHN